MQLPSPPYRRHLEDTATGLVTAAAFGYAGITSSDGIDPVFLAGLGVTFPPFVSLLAVVAANSGRAPQWRLAEWPGARAERRRLLPP
ncbi:MAG: hypothetical protein ABEJ43_10005 [Haloferacaceae archaeon]